MFRISDKPIKSSTDVNKLMGGGVVVTLSDPYYSDPFTIRINITQMTNPSLVAGVSWRILPIPETELPQLNTTTNSISFIADYNIPSLVVELTVALKDGNFQYYHVPVNLEGIPPFESPCEHRGHILNIYTNQNTVRFDIDGVSTGDLSLISIDEDEILYEDSTIIIHHLPYGSLRQYHNHIRIISPSLLIEPVYTSNYTPKSIKFYPDSGEPYLVFTDFSNFPYETEGGIVDLSRLPYNSSEYFLANNCCFLTNWSWD